MTAVKPSFAGSIPATVVIRDLDSPAAQPPPTDQTTPAPLYDRQLVLSLFLRRVQESKDCRPERAAPIGVFVDHFALRETRPFTAGRLFCQPDFFGKVSMTGGATKGKSVFLGRRAAESSKYMVAWKSGEYQITTDDIAAIAATAKTQAAHPSPFDSG